MFSFFKKILRPSAPAPAPAPITAPSEDKPAPVVAAAPAAEAVVAAPPTQAPVVPARVDAPVVKALAEKPPVPATVPGSLIGSALVTPIDIPVPGAIPAERQPWLSKLSAGLRKTGTSISSVFTGTQIDDALWEDLESALLMADAGVGATTHLLEDVKRRVKDGGVTHPVAVKNALIEAIAQLLKPLEKPLVIGEFTPTVIMVAGVNGAGKTTSIGKLTRHLADEGASVLLAAADTFRAAAREQLTVWADRNTVEIISQEGGDPAAVSFDAVAAGKARGKDVVLVDTAGRLPTQLHLMEELKKIKRTIGKAGGDTIGTPPHEILLVIDGNTGQNALAQVKAFDDALQLTGLIVTKLDGTAKGGVLAAIALWARERAKAHPDWRTVPVYFIGVGEKLEDLETFNAREFAQALLT
ncbi:MAG: signal recognition particle-docking protein FtsY [Pseudomonadota bacterium]